MADTSQIVQWTLEMNCQLRATEKSITCPSMASTAVASAQAYSRALRNKNDGFGNYGDVYVSSYTSGTRPGGRKLGGRPKYPANGFIISKEFEPVVRDWITLKVKIRNNVTIWSNT